jgi:hypothetical protein
MVAPVAKHALFVERIGGPLNDLTPRMAELGFQVVRASEAQAVSSLIKSLRRLCLVAVNGDSLKVGAPQLIAGIKTQHPDMPVLWLSKDRVAGRALASKVELVTDDVQKLEAWVAKVAQAHFYSPSFVEQLIGDMQGVLGAFSLPTRAGEACVKSSLTSLNAVNALIFFSGDALSGHVILSASLADLSLAHRTQFARAPFAGQDDLEDLLGEAANQIVGHVKRLIESPTAECRPGLPHFIRGDGASFRHKAGAPSLVVEFGNGGQKLYFELCVHRFDGAGVRVENAVQHLKSGVVNLL